jgi:hypothetical protein
MLKRYSSFACGTEENKGGNYILYSDFYKIIDNFLSENFLKEEREKIINDIEREHND